MFLPEPFRASCARIPFGFPLAISPERRLPITLVAILTVCELETIPISVSFGPILPSDEVPSLFCLCALGDLGVRSSGFGSPAYPFACPHSPVKSPAPRLSNLWSHLLACATRTFSHLFSHMYMKKHQCLSLIFTLAHLFYLKGGVYSPSSSS